MPDRRGWPMGAVERAECANCGKYGFAAEVAPPRNTVDFQKWLERVWPDGRSQHTRLGWFIWCSQKCERVWKATRVNDLDGQTGWAHQHGIEMDRRRMKAGVA